MGPRPKDMPESNKVPTPLPVGLKLDAMMPNLSKLMPSSEFTDAMMGNWQTDKSEREPIVADDSMDAGVGGESDFVSAPSSEQPPPVPSSEQFVPSATTKTTNINEKQKQSSEKSSVPVVEAIASSSVTKIELDEMEQGHNEKANEKLRLQASAFEEEKKAFAAKLQDRAENDRKKFESMKENLEQQIEGLKSKLSDQKKKFDHEKSTLQEKHKDEKERIKLASESCGEELSKLAADHKEAINKLNTEHKEAMTAQMKKSKDARKKAETSLKGIHEEEITSLKLELEETEEKLNKSLIEQRESYEKEIQNMREAIGVESPQVGADDEEGLKSQIFDLESQNRSLEFKVKDVTIENEKLHQNLREKEKANSVAVADITSQLHEVESALELANSQVSDFKIEIESKESTIKVLEKQISILTENASDQSGVEELTAQLNEKDSLVNELNTKITELDELVKSQSHGLSEQEDLIAALEEERDQAVDHAGSVGGEELEKLREVIRERERALEASSIESAKAVTTNEEKDRKIEDLLLEIKTKDEGLRNLQSGAATEMELKKHIIDLQKTVKEKEDAFSNFEREGQILAKKQSEMEKNVRKTKGEMKEKETEITKLKESKAQLIQTIEEMQNAIRKNESDVKDTSKSLSAMQAVSQASADKLQKLEAEVSTKNEELNSQRKALEVAWAESTELKKELRNERAEIESLKRELGEGHNLSQQKEVGLRDVEQREAVLRATNKQLQDNLQRHMNESSSREERLRDEINEMRKRWQDAVTGKENLASELAASTAPLLRQISNLQETLRSKSDNWQSVESILQERAMKAESVANIAESKRQSLEEQLMDTKSKLATSASRLDELQGQLIETETSLQLARNNEHSLMDRLSDLDTKLEMEIAQKQSLTVSLRELESRMKYEVQEAKEAGEVDQKTAEIEISKLKAEKDDLERQLKESNSKITKVKSSSNLEKEVDMKEMGKQRPTISVPDFLPNGETSFAGTEKVYQALQQKDDECRQQQIQIQQIQISRDALLEEVSFLSARNSEIEEKMGNIPEMEKNIQELRMNNDALLILLGEKDEQVDTAFEDLKEVKGLYKSQIEQLLDQVAPAGQTPHNTPLKT